MTARIITPFNRRERHEKRVFINGHWQRPDPAAAMALAWLRAETAVNPTVSAYGSTNNGR